MNFPIKIVTSLVVLLPALSTAGDLRCEDGKTAFFDPQLLKDATERMTLASFVPQAVKCVQALCPANKVKEQEALKFFPPSEQRRNIESQVREVIQAESLDKWKSYAAEKNAWTEKMTPHLRKTPEGSASILANIELAKSVHHLISDTSIPIKSQESNSLYQLRVLKTKLPELTPQERSQVYQTFLDKKEIQRRFSELPQVRALNQIQTPAERTQTLHELSLVTAKRVLEVQHVDPDYVMYSPALVSLIENGLQTMRQQDYAQMTNDEADALLSDLENAFIASEARLQSKQYPSLTRRPPPLSKLLADDDTEKTADVNGFLTIQINDCAKTLTALAANRPTQRQSEEALKNAEIARGLISKNIRGLLSASTAASIEARLARVKYLPAPTVENFDDDLRSLTARNTKAYREKNKAAKVLRESENPNYALAAGYDLPYFYDGATINRILPCSDHQSAMATSLTARDQANFKNETIELSGEYAHSPSMSMDVALHEFMHMADPDKLRAHSNLVSSESKEVRGKIATCLASQFNQALPSNYLKELNDEDFADFGQVLLPQEHILSNCVDFKNLETNRPTGFDLQISQQAHAPHLFRLLHIENLRRNGNLPNECKTAINHPDLQWQFKDCRDPAVYNTTPPLSKRKGRVTIAH